MTKFSEIERLKPPGFVNVPTEAWRSDWTDRPVEEVCIGLRFIADADIEDARVEAYRRAAGLFPEYKESEDVRELFAASFNDAQIRWLLARAMCNPNDVTQVWEGWEAAPEDIAVEQALTDHGAQLIFDRWEAMRVGADIAMPVASDEDIELIPELAMRLPAMALLDRAREQRCRRLLRHVLEELEQFDAPELLEQFDAPELLEQDEPEEDDEEDEHGDGADDVDPGQRLTP